MNKFEHTDRMTREELAELQTVKLRAMLHEVEATNAFYRRKFEVSGFSDETIKSPYDLKQLAFTTKDELVADQQQNPLYGSNLTYPLSRYVRLHQTSGTKGGRPLRWFDTPESWDWFMRCWEHIFHITGIRSDDRFFFPFSFGPFIGFWAAFEAAIRGGHLAIAGGGMTTPARLKLLIENEVTVVCCTPTYALHMTEVAREQGIDLEESKVRALIVAGEPGGSIPATKRRIEEMWGARCFDHSGMTEIGSLGIECVENPGGVHLLETECIAEVIDPQTGNQVRPGERGELVLTNLGRWGSPLIRYRTGDLVEPDTEPCPCGRSLLRLKGGILGRIDDMVTIRGNNVYPAALESILRSFTEITEYRAEVSARGGLGVLSLVVECAPEIGSNKVSLSERVAATVKDSLNFRPEVQVVAPGTLPRFEMKASRFSIHPSYQDTSFQKG